MALENLFIRIKRDIGGIRLDGVISESHENTTRITKNPVELGADITDHAIIEPKRVTIIGEVTDTPLGLAAFGALVDTATGLFGSSESEGVTRSQQAYNLVIGLKNTKEPIEIQTGLVSYESMLITAVRVVQDKNTSRMIRMIIEAEEIILSQTELKRIGRGQLSPGSDTAQAQSNNNRGRQESIDLPDDSAVKKSAAKSITGFF